MITSLPAVFYINTVFENIVYDQLYNESQYGIRITSQSSPFLN